MKSHPFVFLVILANATFVKAQDEPVTSPPVVRILGGIPDGTPPSLALPQRKLVIPAKDVLETKVNQLGGRTVTIRKIKPIPLPPPPAPVPELDPATVAPATVAEFRRPAAECRETHAGTELLFLSATVFRAKDSPPRSLIHWWPQNGGGSITFWSSADFALIAGGINSFVDSAGETHAVIMSLGNVDIDPTNTLRAGKDLQNIAPAIPTFSQGVAAFQFEGSQPDSDEIAAIQSLHDLYQNHLAELTSAWQGRERARAAREAYLIAHPTHPENITINYWRTEEPAEKGDRP